MSNAVFAFHLGGGLYMDSNGDFHQSPPPNVPVYNTGPALPGFSQAGKAVMGVRDAMKKMTEDEGVKNFLSNNGYDTKLLDLISGVAKLAGMVAPALLAISVVIDLAKVFGLLKDGPSALEILVKQRFDDLEKQVQALANLIELKDLRDGRLNVVHFGNEVRDYVNALQTASPSVEQLELDRNMLRGTYDATFAQMAGLMDPQTWDVMFDRTEHTMAWPFIYQLYTLPSGAAPVRALIPPVGALRFDHRLMVPLATFAAHTYLAGIRGISPEYRSTGDFRSDLRTLAKGIDALAGRMLSEGLARTIYTADDFRWPRVVLRGGEVVDPHGNTPNAQLKVSTMCTRWPVGAMDLRHHNNAYFHDFLLGLLKAGMVGWPTDTKYGHMDFRWIPPATLVRGHLDPAGQVWTYSITNPDECAAAANAQSARDYDEMIAASGYFELKQLSVLFRHQSTEPDKSQTVSFTDPLLFRDPMPSAAVTVESDDIFMTGVISAEATREPQRVLAHVHGRTQPIKRARPLSYKIKLRTLDSLVSGKQWLEPEYGQFQRNYYGNDPANPGFMRLESSTSDLALDEHLLASGPSPRERKLTTGTIEMTAHTFDWWIPLPTKNASTHSPDELEADLNALGWIAKYAQPKQPPPGAQLTLSTEKRIVQKADNPIFKFIPELSWKSGAQNWDGEHRDVKEASIEINYTLDWRFDRVHLTVENRPSDRNYVLYLVIEETLTGSGTVLHTVMPVPVNGQLTYVPQEFFDKERAAYENMGNVIVDYTTRYSEFVEVGPEDPVAGWVRPADLVSIDGMQRVLSAARRHQPELLARVITEHSQRRPAAAAELADVRRLPTARDDMSFEQAVARPEPTAG